MRKNLKRGIVLILALMLLLTGCSGDKKTANLPDNAERSLTHKITDEPIELSILYRGPKQEENIFTEAFDRTNVNLKFELGENNTDFDQALALAVVSKKLTDIIYTYKRDAFIEYGMSGALIPLNDLIEEHAPNIKKYFDENPDVESYVTAPDGNIYWIPFVNELQTANGWFIRADWLDKLGLEAPNNLEEFYNTMVAIKTQDPNGNGIQDEVPYFTAKSNVISVMNDFGGLFDAYTSFRYDGDKVSYGPFEPQFKEMIKTVAKWYKEGLIDPEIFTRKSQREYFLGNNLGGITHEWFTSTAAFNDTLGANIEGFRFAPFAPPENVNGERAEYTYRNKISSEGWAITANCKHTVEAIKYFDYWWSREGKIAANYGVEGITYNMVDGEPKFTEEFLASTDPAPMNLRNQYRTAMNWGVMNLAQFEMDLAHPLAKEGMQMYLDNDYLPEDKVQLVYTIEEQELVSKYKGQVETHLSEMMQKWVLGNTDIDLSYELFISEMNSLGADEYIKIEQQAYDRYLGK